MIRELITSIQGMSTVHQMLSKAEWAPIALSDLAIQIISSVLNMTVEKPVHFSVSPSAVTVRPELANNLALILNELTLNFSKHVIPVRPDSTIEVRIHTSADDVILEYLDDGPGFPSAVLKDGRYNTGLYLVQEMTTQTLKGTMELLNSQGACIRLIFKTKAGDA
jgi:two-component sensor histidine kinase